MHSTRPTSSAGQLKGCTNFGASISMATETAILTISHNMKLTALAPGDMLLSRLVMPRAIKAPGTTTVAAPYSADHPTSCRAGEQHGQHGHCHPHRPLRPDHPPGRHRRIGGTQGLRLLSRQRLESP